MGISCDAAAAGLPPRRTGRPIRSRRSRNAARPVSTTRGARHPDSGDPNVQTAVSGQLWWSASNWRNRITVPITMAQTAAVCEVTGGGVPENVYGSQYALQMIQQWAPKFCLDPALFRLQQVQTSEVAAKNLLVNGVSNGKYLGVKAALQAGPPAVPFANPIVQAPTAVSGFAIAFLVDDAKHRQVSQLKLNPRLLAKLLTMSLPGAAADPRRLGRHRQVPAAGAQSPGHSGGSGVPRTQPGGRRQELQPVLRQLARCSPCPATAT